MQVILKVDIHKRGWKAGQSVECSDVVGNSLVRRGLAEVAVEAGSVELPAAPPEEPQVRKYHRKEK